MANSTVIARDSASVRGAACPSCGSVKHSRFPAEMAIHLSGLKNVNKPTVWLFPEVLVCLDCGSLGIYRPEDRTVCTCNRRGRAAERVAPWIIEAALLAPANRETTEIRRRAGAARR